MGVVSSKSVYTAWRLEDVNGSPKIPDKFIPEVENSLNKNIENIPAESRFNVLNNVVHMARGANKIEGKIAVEADPKNIPMWLYMLFGQMTSTDISSLTDGSVYRHTIQDLVCGYKSVTIENKKGWCELSADKTNIVVQRTYGVVPNNTKLTIDSNAIVKLENEVKGQGMFDVAFLIVDEKVEKATKTITTATPTSGLLRVVATGHGLLLNDLVKIAGNSITAYNGYWKVVNVVDADTFDVDCTTTGSAGTGGTVNQISMMYFGERTVKWVLSWDVVRLTNKLWSTEDVTVRYVDEANDVIGFDSITSTAMTVANETKVELVQQTAVITPIDFFSFSNVTFRRGATIADALASNPIDFESISIEFDKKVAEAIQNLKNLAAPTGLDVKLEINKAYENNEDRDVQRKTNALAYIIDLELPKIVSATDTNNAFYSVQLIFPSVVSQTYEITDQTGEIIKEKMMWIAKYDFTNNFSVQAKVVNDKAWTYYTA